MEAPGTLRKPTNDDNTKIVPFGVRKSFCVLSARVVIAPDTCIVLPRAVMRAMARSNVRLLGARSVSTRDTFKTDHAWPLKRLRITAAKADVNPIWNLRFTPVRIIVTPRLGLMLLPWSASLS